jgi:uncharacterized repeat protein (TIGR01451 family)
MQYCKIILSVMLAALIGAAAAWAQVEGHINLISRAEVEKEVLGPDGSKQLQRVPAAQVIPGTQVIFTTAYENTSDQVAENAVITNPLPEHMLYMEGTALGAHARITFSVDQGNSFAIPSDLFIMDAAGRKYPALAKDYTHVRWTIERPLPPGAVGEVSFRAVLQ